MENEIIMENEQVMDNVTDIVTTEGSAKDLLLTVGIGAGVIVGGIILYKKVVKPLIAKAKKKKELDEETEIEPESIEIDDYEDETEE